MIELNPEALAIADALDAERRGKGSRGPLHGIPILIKDNIGTADRMTTTAGSLALEGSIPAAGRLRRRASARGRRGAPRQDQPLRVGQLPLHPLDQRLEQPRRPVPQPLRARPQPVGLQLRLRRGGRRQPRRRRRGLRDRRLDRLPLLASAASSASSRPSACVSRSGIIPISHTQDTAGPMARTVADAAVLLGAMTGVDERDEATRPSRGKARGRLHEVPRSRRAEGRPDRRHVPQLARQAIRWSTRSVDEALAAMKAARRHDRRSRRAAFRGKSATASSRSCSTSSRRTSTAISPSWGPTPPVHTLAEAIEFNERHTRPGDALLRPGDLPAVPQAKGPLTEPAYTKALADLPALLPQGGDRRRCSPSTSSTPSWPRPAAPPG